MARRDGRPQVTLPLQQCCLRKVWPPQGRALVKTGDGSSPVKVRKLLWLYAGATSESATETIPPSGQIGGRYQVARRCPRVGRLEKWSPVFRVFPDTTEAGLQSRLAIFCGKFFVAREIPRERSEENGGRTSGYPQRFGGNLF